MNKDQHRYLRLMQVTSDLVCLMILYFIILPFFWAYPHDLFSVSTVGDFIANGTAHKTRWYLALSTFCLAMPLLMMHLAGGYRACPLTSSRFRLLQPLLFTFLAAVVLIPTCKFLNPGAFCPVLVAALCTLLPMSILSRFHLAHLALKKQPNQNLVRHVILAGTGPEAKAMARHIRTNPTGGYRITGFLSDGKEPLDKYIEGGHVLGHINDIATVIQEHYTDCILYADSSPRPGQFRFLAQTCSLIGMDFAFLHPPDGVEIDEMRYQQRCTCLLGSKQIQVVQFVYQRPEAIFFKRVFDFSAASAIILCCLPLWIVIAIVIKLTSRGPVFFRQQRMGKYGRRFTLFKFRSMYENAEKMQESLMHLNEMDGPAFKIKKDPRLTLTGKFLRKSSLDELPQLFNVFRGDISLVGPRPAIEEEVIHYRLTDRKRLSVIQGITCIWQISGRNDIKFDEWMKLDLLYIEHWSWAQDLKILLRTIPAVLLKKGAY